MFTVKNGEQIFLAVVSDSAWAAFCEAFDLGPLKTDPRLRSNNDRVLARDWLLPVLRAHLENRTAQDIARIFEERGLPFAPIAKPQDLLDDPHLNRTGTLAPITLSDGRACKTVLLPLMLGDSRPGIRMNPPRLGEHSVALLEELGYTAREIETMQAQGLVQGEAHV